MAKCSGSQSGEKRVYSAGTSLRHVRSPAAPKMTMMPRDSVCQGFHWFILRKSHPFHFPLLFPPGVKNPFCIHPLVGVGAEIVALGLDQVCRQPGAAVPVKVGQGCHHRRCRDSRGSPPCRPRPSGRASGGHLAVPARLHEQVRHVRAALHTRPDILQQGRADDAAPPPDAGHFRQVEVVPVGRPRQPGAGPSPGHRR